MKPQILLLTKNDFMFVAELKFCPVFCFGENAESFLSVGRYLKTISSCYHLQNYHDGRSRKAIRKHQDYIW